MMKSFSRSWPAVVLAAVLALTACKDKSKDKPDGEKEVSDVFAHIMKGAKAYFETERVNIDGTRMTCRFPESTDFTPEGSACKQKDKRFAGGKGWDKPTWQALLFRRNEPHYYRYKFERGTPPCKGAKKIDGLVCADSYTATAIGDLDCDGKFSTFIMYSYGYAMEDKTMDCEVKDSPEVRAKDKDE